jgi:preprotein translocase subunit YajC
MTDNSELKVGDWVQTKPGAVGQIVLIARQTAFVEIVKDATMVGFLMSELIKVEPPESPALS